MHVLDRDAVVAVPTVYPIDRIACRMSASFARHGSYLILAILEARLTCAEVTPATVAMAFSIAGGQCGQVMPPMRRSTAAATEWLVAASGVTGFRTLPVYNDAIHPVPFGPKVEM